MRAAVTLCLFASLWLGVPPPAAGERSEAPGPWARMALPGPELLTTEVEAASFPEASGRWAQAPAEPPPKPEAAERERRRQAFLAEREAFEKGLIHFDFDKSELRPDAQEILKRKARFLLRYADIRIQIEGHCDERGTNQYNLALGQRRATSAKNFLASLGVRAERISTISYGEERPLDPGKGEAAWAKNRRAKFNITGGVPAELVAAEVKPEEVRAPPPEAPPAPPEAEVKPEELRLPPPPTVPPPPAAPPEAEVKPEELRAPPPAAPPAPPEEAPLREFLAENLFLLVDITALLNYSKLEDRPGILGGRVDGVVAPALRLREDLFLIALYNGFYDRRRQFFTEDEGPRRRREIMKHEIVPTLRYDFLEHFSVSPHFFATWVFTRETADEDWGDGLYDYQDLGVGFDFKAAREVAEGEEDSAKLTFQFFDREYPNFIALGFTLAQQGTLGPEFLKVKHEKDFTGYLARVGVERKRRTGLLARLEYTFLHKLFEEDRAIEPDPAFPLGQVLTGERRRDSVHTLSGHVGYGWERGLVSLVPKLNFLVRDNQSNQNFNDTTAPLTFPNNEFTKDYFDYTLYQIGPEVSYTFPLPFAPVQDRLLTTTLSYTHEIRDYDTRPAKNRDGSLKGESEEDVTDTVALTFVLTLSERWALL
ncbi:MAG: peptidoglycan-associated lipoprotein Pal, partial [Nitrospinota bacterium]